MQYIVEAIDFFAFITAISVAICFLPSAISVFDIWSRLSLSPAQYMVIQRFNGGASFFGVTVTVALLLTLAYTLSIRGNRSAILLSVAASMFLIGAELIFWLITYQINAITKQWTVAPDNFEIARKRWEYAEATSAIFTFLALVTILLSIAAAGRTMGV
jgi:hypothetical protein